MFEDMDDLLGFLIALPFGAFMLLFGYVYLFVAIEAMLYR